MARALNIACLQTRPMPDFDSALAEALPLAEQAVQAGARVLFLPEYCGGMAADGPRLIPPVAAEANHPFLKAFRDFARAHSVWALVGSLAIDVGHGKFANRGYLIDDWGDISGAYDKIHLFDIQLSDDAVFRESATVRPGDRAVIYDTPFGRIGHTICYDLRFPQLYRALAQAGADILCVPAAFIQLTGRAHWHVLNRARAIETGAFVVSACATANVPGGGPVYGHSLVVDPWGEVLADGGEEPGVVHATLDLDKVVEARTRIPSLRHDRAFAAADNPKSQTA
ncbi:carbon-nitrogen hydrolase family protein [Rhodobacteraceae bacterium R_SAG10]|nr:carbon-nitrogen hydrolase family protein [Rhodobacteraceae bacterium R_SAG10]